EEVVITGTLLRHVHPTSPVVTFDREDFARLGVSTVEDLLRSLPQNTASFNSESSRNSELIGNSSPLASNGHQGNSAVNLRGIGANGTLVLVNGRRTSSSPLGTEGSFVNLSTLPLGTVERVEILLDGASALYGADAVGGVINIITKRDYQGAETSVRYENGLNDGNHYSLRQTLGFGWETGNLSMVLEQQEIQAVSQTKAGFTSLDYRPRGGTDFSNSQFGLAVSPGAVYRVNGFGFAVELLGALPPGSDGIGKQGGDFTPENARNAFADAFRNREFTATTINKSASVTVDQEVGSFETFLELTWALSEHDGGDTIPSLSVLVS
ncbi:MAG: TonB-dependent receptor plug domain-containing protein, partial [Porticoccaceae bacterium]|nr:TonB-dependent receptor plug domain-containing protein [Porticoccaceae bacterium]